MLLVSNPEQISIPYPSAQRETEGFERDPINLVILKDTNSERLGFMLKELEIK